MGRSTLEPRVTALKLISVLEYPLTAVCVSNMQCNLWDNNSQNSCKKIAPFNNEDLSKDVTEGNMEW